MTPQEKAKQLFDSMRLSAHPILTPDAKDKMAKNCAEQAAEEIRKEVWLCGGAYADQREEYWYRVIQEIEKL